MKKILCAFLIAGSLLTYCVILLINKSKLVQHSDSLTQGAAGSHQLSPSEYADGNTRFQDVQNRLTPHLEQALAERGFKLGSPVFLRSFKDERILEIWMQDETTATFRHLHSWKMAGMSGGLGPKLKEGDKQSPEGFYHVSLPQFLPSSANHLAFNVGYPNQYDRSLNRTGSFIMVHGRTGSIGCLAMTDAYMEEIYTICHAAVSSRKQEAFQIQMLPFRLTDKNLNEYKSHQWIDFWHMLKPGYDYFEQYRIPPSTIVRDQAYIISGSHSS